MFSARQGFSETKADRMQSEQNLFDNEFDTTGFALIAFGQPLSQRNPGEQRTYGVRARKSF